eukprot:3441115-Prymnesium_polylepis.1
MLPHRKAASQGRSVTQADLAFAPLESQCGFDRGQVAVEYAPHSGLGLEERHERAVATKRDRWPGRMQPHQVDDRLAVPDLVHGGRAPVGRAGAECADR